MAKVISVVIPTMWKANEFLFKLLPLIEWSFHVGEIIIVDNNPAEAPLDELQKYHKIVRHVNEKNVYWNKSANIGAALAVNEVLCFANDDMLFDPYGFDFIARNITDEHGLVTVNADIMNRGSENAAMIPNIKFVPTVKQKNGATCLMFITKSNYRSIPEELRHHFGDTYLYDMMVKEGKTNHTVDNWTILTPMQVTTRTVPEVHEVIEQDWEIAEKVFKKHGLENPIRYA